MSILVNRVVYNLYLLIKMLNKKLNSNINLNSYDEELPNQY
jgi:hypothetical protein